MRYRNKLVLIAWEHTHIEKTVRALLAVHGGDPEAVPKWYSADFDSVYIIRMIWSSDNAKATFEHKQQGLDGLPKACPR